MGQVSLRVTITPATLLLLAPLLNRDVSSLELAARHPRVSEDKDRLGDYLHGVFAVVVVDIRARKRQTCMFVPRDRFNIESTAFRRNNQRRAIIPAITRNSLGPLSHANHMRRSTCVYYV